MKRPIVLISMLLLATAAPQAAFTGEAPHSREYWKAIVENDYALPEGESAYDLIVELSGHLGSPDSELRDDFGYGIPAAWIYRQHLLDSSQLLSLLEAWSRNLTPAPCLMGDDSVLLRSFSALNLSLLAAYDNQKPFMESAAFRNLLNVALNYLATEHDLRGWEAPAGWYHATAHTADLLKFQARSRHLQPEDQVRILSAIAQRLRDTDGYIFDHNEDERLAATVVSIIARDDLDAAAFEKFAEQLAATSGEVRSAAAFAPKLFAAQQNSKNLLRALHIHLSRFKDELSPEQQRLHQSILTTLWEM